MLRLCEMLCYVSDSLEQRRWNSERVVVVISGLLYCCDGVAITVIAVCFWCFLASFSSLFSAGGALPKEAVERFLSYPTTQRRPHKERKQITATDSATDSV